MPPYRLTAEVIQRERDRYGRARALVEAGDVAGAHRVWWWPDSEEFPKAHWSEKQTEKCSCRRRAPEGMLGLCGYCGGITTSTPKIVGLPRRVGS